MAPLHLYDGFSTVQPVGAGVRTTDPGDAARIELLIAELRLPAIKQVWPSLAAQADKEDWPAGRFLAALAEHEVAERSRRRLERHLAEARLPPGKTLDTFDFEVVPVVSKAQVRALAAGDAWLSNGADLVLFGPPGGGKIHVAAAFGFALVESGWRVLFTRTTDLVRRLQLARRELALEGAIAKLDKIHLLILDDLAYLTSGFDRPSAGPTSGPTLPSIPEWEIMTSQIAGHRGTVSLWPILILVFYVRPPAKPAKLAPILGKLWDFSRHTVAPVLVIRFAECKPACTSYGACSARGQVQKHRIDDSRCK